MNVQKAIQEVVAGRLLSEEQAVHVARAVMAGDATPAQVGGLLVALRIRGETVDEIAGFVRAVREAAIPFPLSGDDLLDTCGTGGDGRGTFNISTACAFVAAAAGCRVAKHGNRSVSSRCGSADVLAELGIAIELPPGRTAESIEQLGIGFMYAPQYNPGARHAVAPRREIGIRSIFNTIGPLVHPAGAKRQLLGVYAPTLAPTMAAALQRLRSVHCLIVHSDDGLDEISLSAPTQITELKHETVTAFKLDPRDFGFTPAPIDAIAGGDASSNARMIRAVLAGDPGPARDVVLLNSGAAIYAGGMATTIAEGIDKARAALDSGAAGRKLTQLAEFGRSGPE